MGLKENLAYKKLSHGFAACYDSESKILVLGSFPSVKSREANFYYGHPMNRFWPLLSKVYGIEIPNNIDGKKKILKDIHVALYDVIDSCDIVGSSDASIKNVVATDLLPILKGTKVQKILLNGKKAGALFEKYQLPVIGRQIPYVVMPSTSPANAATRFDDLLLSWKEELGFACE